MMEANIMDVLDFFQHAIPALAFSLRRSLAGQPSWL
jgi:hypothetical protein